MTNEPKRVLIAQQSTIPHYRVRFYDLLADRCPAEWSFDVVYDRMESRNPQIYPEPVDADRFLFSVLDARTHIMQIGGRRLVWQGFWGRASGYDLIITDTHLSNLTYPMVRVFQVLGRRHISWGHIRDMNQPSMAGIKKFGESLKLQLVRRSDRFFAYTEGTRREACAMGVKPERITVLNNTIDTLSERARFLRLRHNRQDLRRQFGVANRFVLLHVGRLIPGKRVEFLLEALRHLRAREQRCHLFLVGGGVHESMARRIGEQMGGDAITVFGAVADAERLAPLFVASDLFVLPGTVGLAPLQSFCHELPVVAFDLGTHGPEFEYLCDENSTVLPAGTTPADFAQWILGRVMSPENNSSGDRIYETIRHLTLEKMAERFVEGVGLALQITPSVSCSSRPHR